MRGVDVRKITMLFHLNARDQIKFITMTTKPEIKTVSIKVRLGTADDFRKSELKLNPDGVTSKMVLVPNYGQCYWVKSQFNNQFMNRHYIINDDTDWDEFRAFLAQEMVYVPINDAWLDEYDEKSESKTTDAA